MIHPLTRLPGQPLRRRRYLICYRLDQRTIRALLHLSGRRHREAQARHVDDRFLGDRVRREAVQRVRESRGRFPGNERADEFDGVGALNGGCGAPDIVADGGAFGGEGSENGGIGAVDGFDGGVEVIDGGLDAAEGAGDGLTRFGVREELGRRHGEGG